MSGLKEAKELSEAAPCVLAEGMTATRAERFRAELVKAARVRGSATPLAGRGGAGGSEQIRAGMV